MIVMCFVVMDVQGFINLISPLSKQAACMPVSQLFSTAEKAACLEGVCT